MKELVAYSLFLANIDLFKMTNIYLSSLVEHYAPKGSKILDDEDIDTTVFMEDIMEDCPVRISPNNFIKEHFSHDYTLEFMSETPIVDDLLYKYRACVSTYETDVSRLFDS